MGKDALKFAKTFHVKVNHEDTTEVGTKEDYYPMGYILSQHGQSVQDYKDVEGALVAVRHLCTKNQEEHGYAPEDKPEIVDEQFPEFSKFWYVFSLGKTETHTSTVGKKLEQDTDLKTLKQLDEAKCFMEGVGFSESAGPSTVHIENVKWQDLQKQVELVKLPYSSVKPPGDNVISFSCWLHMCVHTHVDWSIEAPVHG